MRRLEQATAWLLFAFTFLSLSDSLVSASETSQTTTDEKRRLSHQIVTLTGFSTIWLGMMDAGMKQRFDGELTKKVEEWNREGLSEKQTEERRDQYARYYEEFIKRVKQKIGAEDLGSQYEEFMADLYERVYTEDELRTVLEFVKTPAGQKGNEWLRVFNEFIRSFSAHLAPTLMRIMKEAELEAEAYLKSVPTEVQ